MDSQNCFDNSKYNFADLPTEMILKILSYLKYDDQHTASMVCLRWFEASTEYFSKVKISFLKICLSDDSFPGQLFINSLLPYENLELIDVVIFQTDKFFEKLGKSVRRVSFSSLDLNEKQFCSVLKKLEYITELTIENNSPLFMAGQFLESEQSQNLIKENMANLKLLSLKNNQYLSDAILMRIIKLTQNLEDLDFSCCHIACHNAIQKRFYPQYLENVPSESLLTLKYIVKAIETQASTLICLNLSDTLVDGIALSIIASIKDLRLKKVILRSCRQINLNGFDGFVSIQNNILVLDISNSEGINDSCIELLKNLTNLEELRLRHCWKITDESTKVLSNLKRLKVLDISNCIGISSNGVKDNLVKEKNLILTELYLTAIDLYENCVIQCAENLPNLRVFDIGYCCNGVTDKSLGAIIKNQTLLRNLNLQTCHLITDAAITGCNLDEFVTDNSNQTIDNFNSHNLSNCKPIKISLCSKAEQQIIEEAERAKVMLSLLNKNINIDVGVDSQTLSRLKGLEVLNISGCTKISDISLKYGLKFHELRELDISNCQQISVRGIECLTTNCKSIEIFSLSNCPNINQDSIDIIHVKLKRLKVLNCVGCTLE